MVPTDIIVKTRERSTTTGMSAASLEGEALEHGRVLYG